MAIIDHPHIQSIRVQHEIIGEELRMVAIIDTDLVLDPSNPAFTSQQLARNDLYAMISNHMEHAKYFHHARVTNPKGG